MLHLIRIGIGASVTPWILSLDNSCTITDAFRAHHTLTHPVRRTFNLSARADSPHIARIEKFDAEMVEDITMLRARTVLPTAYTMPTVPYVYYIYFSTYSMNDTPKTESL